jgi:hypothetical protein
MPEAVGPFSIRDLDVKFRTGEISSKFHAWKEGNTEWLPIFEIQEIKDVLEEGAKEQEHILNETQETHEKP